jgi:hypothetical protein
MAEKVVVFRVSSWFLRKINEYCQSEKISYAELFSRAINHLCQKYLVEEDYAEAENSGREDRSGNKNEALQETLQDSSNVGEDEV